MSLAADETTPLVEGVLREQLLRAQESFGDNDGKVQKSEFKVLLLGLGIRVRQAVLDDMFIKCDTDGDGGLTIDELLQYITTTTTQSKESSSSSYNALVYTFHQTTTSFLWWFAVAFHFAAWVGITSFVCTEEGTHLRPEWSIVGAWFFFFGAVYFFKLLHDAESAKYDTMVNAKIILKTCVVQDPTFFDQKAGDDATMNMVELNAVLEELGLYLPKGIVQTIVGAIDTDGSGTITQDEMVQFAKSTATKDPSATERLAAIHEAVVHTWGFWSLICWLIGSILFLVAAHLNYAGIQEPPLPQHTYLHLYGMGSVMYFLLAVCMIPMLENEARDFLESIEQMGKAFAHKREQQQSSNGGKATTIAELFQSLDVNDDGQGDGNIDPVDLYEVLMEEGVLVPYGTFLEVFTAADTSGDGALQAGEFADFIANMKVAKDPSWQYTWQMIQRFPFSSSFFGWLMFFIGGIFYTLGSYLDVSDSVWWYFAGAVCYGLASGKNVFLTIRGHWLHFHAVEAGTAQFKARIAKHGMSTSSVA